MPFTTILIAFAAAAYLANMIEQNQQKADLLFSHVDLKPLNRQAILNFTGQTYIYDDTNRYITSTVGDIYVGVLKSATAGNMGYNHPLKPFSLYQVDTYMPVIISRLQTLFPDCTIEYNNRVNLIGVYWYL
jgi:hypothetical protein